MGAGLSLCPGSKPQPMETENANELSRGKARHLSADSMIFDMHIEYIRIACCTTVMMTHIDSYSYL